MGQDILCDLISGSPNGNTYFWIEKEVKDEFGTML